ncbi:MAG: hypothetical protein ACOYOI_10315, partial [Chthoniobacterales bacterium]
RNLTLAWKTYHSTSREFIYEQTSTRTKPANRISPSSYFCAFRPQDRKKGSGHPFRVNAIGERVKILLKPFAKRN